MRRLLTFIILALLTGCATPEGMTRVKSPEKVVYEIPSVEIAGDDLFSGIRFEARGFDSVMDGYKYFRRARVVPRGQGRCEVEFITSVIPVAYDATISPTVTFKSYIFKVEEKKKRGTTRLEFKPLYEVDEPVMSLRSEKLSPPHSIENALEVIATSGTVTFRFEVDSPHDPASIVQNFRKYLKEQRHVPQPVEVMGESFQSSYLLLSGGNPLATFYVSPHPHGEGSRVSVIAKVHLAPDESYHVDVSGQLAEVRKLIQDVVE